ncbi:MULTISPECIES: rhodanese-like domain-containing protein [unclassified Pseudodesulfovibrio]|uniref:rhodanese-like domain-containing protein n=1 Tax=unclassified Pseudodesulfovibrio TaxID=2661612 RepID=UPI0019D4C652|nr:MULTISPECIES: rhodanese-like domain-containing protein [unclassified Pseudodesulfovibrio]MCJ2166195.1 rhodanese-like domain-containing protein [Pseudodesulfovibrio sp. S3-i]
MRVLTIVVVVVALLMLWDVSWWFGFGVSPLSPYTLKMEVNRKDAPVIIDVRTPAEFELFHIPGAINVPYPASLAELALAAPDPSRPAVVVCMTGHRSPPVVRQMQQGGYTNVHNLTWGMVAWKLFGGDTVSGR